MSPRADQRPAWEWHASDCPCSHCDPHLARTTRRIERATLASVAIGAAYILARVIGA